MDWRLKNEAQGERQDEKGNKTLVRRVAGASSEAAPKTRRTKGVGGTTRRSSRFRTI
jgi:hypothetical protein